MRKCILVTGGAGFIGNHLCEKVLAEGHENFYVWIILCKANGYDSKTKSIFSLSILQGVDYILPMIPLLYLMRVLCSEKFGLMGFPQVFVNCFRGFNR